MNHSARFFALILPSTPESKQDLKIVGFQRLAALVCPPLSGTYNVRARTEGVRVITATIVAYREKSLAAGTGSGAERNWRSETGLQI